MSTLPDVLRPLLAGRVVPDGDHLMWTGTVDRGSPYVKTGGSRYSVRRLICEETYGRGLYGEAKTACGVELCIAPGHVHDALGRHNTAALQVMLDALDQAMPALLAREAARTEAVAA